MEQSIKTELHQLIDNCDNEILLKETKALLQSEAEQKDWWDELTEEDKTLILRSEAEYESGKFISHNDLTQQLQEWQKK